MVFPPYFPFLPGFFYRLADRFLIYPLQYVEKAKHLLGFFA